MGSNPKPGNTEKPKMIRQAEMQLSANTPMSKLKKFIYTSLIGGFAVLLPIYLAVLFIQSILAKIIHLIRPLVVFIKSFIPINSEILGTVLSLFLLTLLCLLGGIFFKTSLGFMAVQSIEPKLNKIPGYQLFKTLTKRVTGFQESEDLAVAFVALGAIDQALSVGFVIRHRPGVGYVVFVPAAPAPAAGGLYILSEDKVFLTDIPLAKAAQFYSQYGAGADEFLSVFERQRRAQ